MKTESSCQSTHCMFALLDSLKKCVHVRSFQNQFFSSIIVDNAVWPNFTYNVQINEESIEMIKSQIQKSTISPYVLLDLYDAEKHEALLTENGFVPLEFWPCMSMKNEIQFDEQKLTSINFEQVHSRSQVTDWVNIANYGFGQLNPKVISDLIGKNTELFIGKIEHEIVVSVMIQFHENQAGIYYLVTDPKHKQKGIGTATFVYCQKRIMERGTFELQIQSTKEGYNTWKKMGMKDCGNLVLMTLKV